MEVDEEVFLMQRGNQLAIWYKLFDEKGNISVKKSQSYPRRSSI